MLGTSCIFSSVCLCDAEPKAVSEAAQEAAEKQKSPKPLGLAEAAIEPGRDSAGRRGNQISLSLQSTRARGSMLPVQGRTPPLCWTQQLRGWIPTLEGAGSRKQQPRHFNAPARAVVYNLEQNRLFLKTERKTQYSQ